MIPWGCTPSHLYKGLATLVIALIALQYLFGSVLETRRTTVNEHLTAQDNYEASLRNKIRGQNLSKPRFYQSSSVLALKKPESMLLNALLEEITTNSLNSTTSNNTLFEISNQKSKSSENCPIVSPELEGPVKVNKTYVPSIAELEFQFSWLKPGGNYAPDCITQHVVAVIIPYRDRAEHLLLFLAHMHPFLKKQQIDYTIYIVEQDGNDPFNRAMLMNVGFVEALKHRNYHCFIFHDVDLLPEDDRNIYNCPEQPRHMSVGVDVLKYRLPYATIFGGVCAMTREHFQLVNGFSNLFWGWGGEDDDMNNRISYHNLHISRYPINIARYSMLSHLKSKANPKRYETLIEGKKKFNTEGLNNLKYTLKNTKFNLLYTWVLVEFHTPS